MTRSAANTEAILSDSYKNLYTIAIHVPFKRAFETHPLIN
jgi:hypothetical protein